MKIRTYVAKDMRQALRQVREEQGPDAVILSTRTVPGGVEVAAAIDFEQAVAGQAVLTAAATQEAPAPASEFASLMARAAEPAVPLALRPTDDLPLLDGRPPAEVGAELRTMRHMLETQLAQLAWNDLTRRVPAQAELLKDLTELGLSQALASDLVRELPVGNSFEEGQRRALAVLSRRINVTGDALLEHGGRVAFVGPTGVGKTTAIAKIAARWVMRHGSRDIALVSIDGQRFGAQEQLKVLGRLLGVEAFTLEEAGDLPELLARLPERRLVLIDTAGMSPRDPELSSRAQQFNAYARVAAIRCCLVLSAGSQAGVLEEAAERFAAFLPTNCLITKIDEAASLGGTLSMLARTQLPVSYVSEGQRIPEDLAPARAHQLVARAVFLARQSGAVAGEELLTSRFGGAAHAAA